MPNVYWFDDARDEFESLPERTRDAIERRLANLRRFPAIYQVVETGEFAGFRRFVVDGRLHIYYAVKGDAEHCYVRAIRFARAAPR